MQSTPSRPLDVLWQAPALIWTLLAGECLAIALALAPGHVENRWIYFGLASFLIQWVTLLTLGTLYVFRRFLVEVRPQRIAWLALALLLVCTWAVVGLASSVLGRNWPTGPGGWPMLMLQLTGIALAVGVLGLAAFQSHWRAKQYAIKAKQAELESLQARTHPHFLFNTLNTGAALVHARPEAAEKLLLDLADLFRAALTGPQYISLAEELELTQRYLEIEQLRLGDRLSVDWELPSPIPEARVPSLSVQPLVENAVRHGIERRVGGGRVAIMVTGDAANLCITVRNDMPAGSAGAATNGHGVGRASVGERIHAMTDGRGSLQASTENGRYVATIRLPLDNAD